MAQQRTDEQIQADIIELLRSAGLPLTASVEDGVLRLQGIVTSEAEREAALDLARLVSGVDEIIDDLLLRELEIDSPNILLRATDAFDGADEERGDDGVTTDPRIAVQEGLVYFPPTDPPTRIDNGDLDIASGFMSTALDDDIEEAEDGIIVDDDELVRRVLRNLRQDARTTHLKLYVSSLNGTVILTGFVEDNLDAESAVAVAGDTVGVREVIDRTVVGSPPDVPPERRPLHRRAQMAHVVTPNASWRATVIANRFRLEQMRADIKERLESVEAHIRALGRDQDQENPVANHEADVASDLVSAGTLDAEARFMRDQLAEIEEALRRMDEGTYGICVDTGQLIEAARLKANPLAIRTVEAQRRFEQLQER